MVLEQAQCLDPGRPAAFIKIEPAVLSNVADIIVGLNGNDDNSGAEGESLSHQIGIVAVRGVA